MLLKKNHIGFLFTALISIGFWSCVDDVDFNQAENIVLRPVLESDLVFSTLAANNFIDNSTEQEVVMLMDTTRLETLNSGFFTDNLTKVDLLFKFQNSLPRAFNIDLDFYNDNNEVTFQLQLPVDSGSETTPITSELIASIEEPQLSTFKQTTYFIYTLNLPPTNTPLNTTINGEINLQSKATFYFEI